MHMNDPLSLLDRKVKVLKICKMIKKLSALRSYGFCRGHSLALGHLVWALAYCKAHFPEKFWLATLNYSNTEWRSWVHYRSAMLEGGLCIPQEKQGRDWELKGKRLVKRHCEAKTQKQITDYFQTKKKKTDFSPQQLQRLLGFWTGKDFMPNICKYSSNLSEE